MNKPAFSAVEMPRLADLVAPLAASATAQPTFDKSSVAATGREPGRVACLRGRIATEGQSRPRIMRLRARPHPLHGVAWLHSRLETRGQGFWIAAAAALLCTVAVVPAAAALGPTAQIKQAVDHVLEVLQDPRLTPESKQLERRRLLRAIADEIFDFEAMSRRAMAIHWRPLTEVQRREFVGLFSEVLEWNYVWRIEQYSGEKMLYSGERVEDDVATVFTRIVRKDGTEIPVDYRLLRRDDRWLAYDVSIEGISLVGNYRTQFHNVIQMSSYEALVKKLRDRVEELQLSR